MGIDIVKSNNTRCRSLFDAGLLLMCLYLVCTWWSLSSQSAELLKQLDSLSEQLRINGEEIAKCFQDRTILDEKLKDSQNRFVQQQIKIEQVKESEDEVKESYQKVEAELQESKKRAESIQKDLDICQAELESLKKLGESKDKATETLRTENESLKSEIEQKEKQFKDLEEQFKALDKTLTNTSDKTHGSQPNNLLYTLAKNYLNIYKNSQKTANPKTEKDVKGIKDKQTEDKFDGEGKNYADSGLLAMDNDPREEEMKENS